MAGGVDVGFSRAAAGSDTGVFFTCAAAFSSMVPGQTCTLSSGGFLFSFCMCSMQHAPVGGDLHAMGLRGCMRDVSTS